MGELNFADLIELGGLGVLAAILFWDKIQLNKKLERQEDAFAKKAEKLEENYRDCLEGREKVWKEVAEMKVKLHEHNPGG